MNITKILSWMENYDSLVELPKLQKILFMMTNITYFIPIVFFGINIISIIIAIMGTVSTSFHGCQCCLKCLHKGHALYYGAIFYSSYPLHLLLSIYAIIYYLHYGILFGFLLFLSSILPSHH